MSLNPGTDWYCHWEMEFLAHACKIVDEPLERCYACIDADFDAAEQCGMLDMVEYLVGLGFAACQGYITGVCTELGVSKGRALGVGPKLENDTTIVSLANHAANWWKHSDEWHHPLAGRALQTHNAVKAVEFSGQSPLYDVLAALTNSQPPLFRELAVQFSAWREAVLEISPRKSSSLEPGKHRSDK